MFDTKHVPLMIEVAGKPRDFTAEMLKDEIVGLYYDWYEQGRVKHVDVSFMLDDMRDEILAILENDKCAD